MKAPTVKDARLVAEMSRDFHRPEGPSEEALEKRDQVLADLLTAAWPTKLSQSQ